MDGLVGGAVLGYAVNKLLDEVLIALRHLKNRSRNLLKLQNLLEDLQPSVQELSKEVRDETHHAGKWLIKLREELQKARDLATASGNAKRNIFKLVSISKTSVELYDRIHALLQEASALVLASGTSTHRTLVETGAKILAEMAASQDKQDQLIRVVANLNSTTEVTRTMSKLHAEVFNSGIDDRSGSSAAVRAGRFSEDVPKPEVYFGGDSVANELKSQLFSGECKKWVALWGMGGIGKTFNASKLYHDSNVKRHFAGGIFWLTVSKDQPGSKHLLRQLLEKLEGSDSVSQLPDNLEEAKSFLRRKLERERVLLILDDVWQSDVGPNDVLEDLDVVSESRKGVILVTTRDQGVLRRKIDSVDIIEIPPLSEEDGWQLFSWHAFHVRSRVVPGDLEAVAKEVARECRGLPLALEVIGSTMADKELLPGEKALGLTSLRIWEVALKQLRNANHGESEYGALYKKLQVSVESLEDQDPRLWDCFCYFAAFAEDEDVDVEDLVHMWIAEGLVQEDVRSSFTSEEDGKVLLGYLVTKSMIKVTKAGSACKVHDVMRDLAQRNLKWNVVTGEEIEPPGRDCLYAPGLQEIEFPKEWVGSHTSFSAKRLSLRRNELLQFPGPEQLNTPHLQVLILSFNQSLQSLSAGYFLNLSNLRVLDLSDTSIREISGEWLRKLKSLVLLNLSRCRSLQEVTNELSSLQCLEFLYLDRCRMLETLPRVDNLRNLKKYSAAVPVGNSTTDSSAGLHCYGRFLGGGRRRHPDSSRRGTSYKLPANLRQLYLSGTGSADGDRYFFDISSLCTVEKLSLRSLSSFPTGMANLCRLKVLKIVYCGDTPVATIGKLPLLEEFDWQCNPWSATKSCGHVGSFPSLKKFRMVSVFGVEEVFVFHPGTMPKLECLEIVMLKAEQLPTSITNLPGLKRLILELSGSVGDDDIEFLFRDKGYFPHLERFEISGFFRTRSGHGSITFPRHILERQEQGRLTVVDRTK